jgi:hypothetical protein
MPRPRAMRRRRDVSPLPSGLVRHRSRENPRLGRGHFSVCRPLRRARLICRSRCQCLRATGR